MVLLCCECGANSIIYSAVHDLEIHIANEHLSVCVYECETCRFAKFPTEHALADHYQNVHNQDEFYIRYRYSLENKRKLDLLRDKVALSIRKHESKRYNDQPSSSSDFSKNGHRDQFLYAKHPDGQLYSRMEDDPPLEGGDPQTSSGNSGGSNEKNSGEPNEKRRDPVACQLCGVHVSNQRSSLVYHVNTKHAKLNLFECAACSKVWNTIARADILKHVKAAHEGDESFIVDNRKILAQQLRNFTAICFPRRNLGRKRPMSQGVSPERNLLFGAPGSAFLHTAGMQSALGFQFNGQSPFMKPKTENGEFNLDDFQTRFLGPNCANGASFSNPNTGEILQDVLHVMNSEE